jgi:hypothetical protein
MTIKFRSRFSVSGIHKRDRMPPNYGFNAEWTEPFANVIPAVNEKVETPIGF